MCDLNLKKEIEIRTKDVSIMNNMWDPLYETIGQEVRENRSEVTNLNEEEDIDVTTKIEVVDDFVQQIDEQLESLPENANGSDKPIGESPPDKDSAAGYDPLATENAEEEDDDDFSASEAVGEEDETSEFTLLENGGLMITRAKPRPRVEWDDSDSVLSVGTSKEKNKQQTKGKPRNSRQRGSKKRGPDIRSVRGRGKGKGRGKGLSNRWRNWWSTGEHTAPGLYSDVEIHKTYTNIFGHPMLRIFDGLPEENGDLIPDNLKCSKCKTRDFRCPKEFCLKDEKGYTVSAQECCRQRVACLCPKVYQLPDNRYTEVMSLFNVSRAYGRHTEQQLQQMCKHFQERAPDVPTVAARAAYLIGASVERQRQTAGQDHLETKRKELASLDQCIAERRETLLMISEQIGRYQTTRGSEITKDQTTKASTSA